MIMYHGVLDKMDAFKQYEDEFYTEVGKYLMMYMVIYSRNRMCSWFDNDE